MSNDSRIELRPKAVTLTPAERAQAMQDLGFGRLFTEHMVTIPCSMPTGESSSAKWGKGVLSPYQGITLDPAASVLHYGQAIFEGFKAYRQADGGIKTFRPDQNARRLNSSARRLAMPELPEDLFVLAADTLIRQEKDWVPNGVGESLYLRPLMLATEAALGVRPAKEYLFILFGSPSGLYFKKGVKPVSVWVSTEYVRAAPGGTGATKCAGNYAASLVAQQAALAEGCDQVVWLDAVHRKYVEEMGGMNLFFVYSDAGKVKLVTPKLTGSLLPGITRSSLLTLAQENGYAVEERLISVDEWKADLESGSMTEVFACGTAAVITPVGTVKTASGEWSIRGGEAGPVAQQLREQLLAIQHGTVPDKHGWMHTVC
ncbi:MAG: branched-chain amino acid aminotransferase [Polyangiaceae bacterium]|nr:branched-chain amino acid aminotransferase [Polyangiaceae bacterium]